ncbi:MAG: LacI family DNA-binding transcriptional regulator [Chloroflexota bacterium]|nr:LacI family DNA-binding transcriptional regulator [Chloroflexota bacterium]
MPTIKEVAHEAGVSIATVSYVLNNKTDMVSAETARIVLETARRLGYRPNVTARNLQSSRTGLIGYAWHTLPGEEPHWLMDRFIYYLAQAAEAVNHHLLTFTHPYGDSIRVYDELILSGRLDGFILSETNTGDPRIPFLLDKQFPFVSFGRADADLQFPYVDTDSQAGLRIAVEYLVSLGHRRIAFCGWNTDSLTGNFRYAGYREAMAAYELPVPPHYITRGIYGDEHIPTAFAYWATLPHDQQPTAIVTVSDYVAIAAIRAAEQCGHRIGDTLSVVGFDDSPVGRYVTPTLTTLRQPLRAITTALMTMLDATLQKTPYEPPQRLFAPELIIRASSGAPQPD